MANQSSAGKSPTEKLLAQGEELRVDVPVLWAVIRGRGAPGRIGLLIGMPTTKVAHELDRLKRAGIIYSSERFEQPVYMLNPKYDGYSRYKQLATLYQALEMKWLTTSGISPDKEKGLVSSAVLKKWREENPSETSTRGRSERYDDTLTMKQAAVLVAVGMGWADRSTFKPLELARLQGYSQGGYAKQSLIALEAKGYVQSEGTRHFRLTHAGVEKVKELQEAGIKAARRQEEVKIEVDTL